MKRMHNCITVIFLFAFIFTGVIKSQTLQETLTKLTGTAGEAYVAPIISGFGANLNSGWVHKSPSSKVFGIDIEVGVVGMATMFGDNNKSFNTSADFRFSSEQAMSLINNSAQTSALPLIIKNGIAYEISKQNFTVGISGPTIIGDKNSEVSVNFSEANITSNNISYKIDKQSIATGAKGFLGDMSALPLAAPQFSFGTVFGTMASVRFLPNVKMGELGELSYFGFGLQHNPAVFLPIPLPVDLSAAFFTQSLKVGDIFKVSATSFGLYASKTFGWGVTITPFAGFAIENSSVDVSYDVNYATPAPGVTIPGKIEFTMEGENSTRLTTGASIKLFTFNLTVDYSIAKYKSASLGLNFIL